MALTPSSPLISNIGNRYGNFRAFKSSNVSDVTFFMFQLAKYEGTNNLGDLFITYYNQSTGNTPVWVHLANQSDLTALSNSVVKTLDNVAPVNNNINMWNWFHRYPYTDFTNGMTTIEWINKGLFSCYFSGESQTFPQKPTEWGQLINIPASSPNSGGSEAFQLFVAQASGDIYYRGTNQNNQLDEVPFKRLTYVGEGWAISKGTNGWARESSTGFTIQWGQASSELSKGKTGDWAFPNSVSTSFTFPRSFTTVYKVIPYCTTTSTSTKINLGAYTGSVSTKSFTHWSSISWETTVAWTPCYVAIGLS